MPGAEVTRAKESTCISAVIDFLCKIESLHVSFVGQGSGVSVNFGFHSVLWIRDFFSRVFGQSKRKTI